MAEEYGVALPKGSIRIFSSLEDAENFIIYVDLQSPGTATTLLQNVNDDWIPLGQS